MASVTHILDTSAILAHYFDEPGADEVNVISRMPPILLKSDVYNAA